MSTRCTINFCWGTEAEAKIYRHWDGYPHGVQPDLEQFFKDVEQATDDHRFHDPSYLAAKFVVWQAEKNGSWLDFLGLGVLMEDPMDIEYTYIVDCKSLDENGWPTITYRSV